MMILERFQHLQGVPFKVQNCMQKHNFNKDFPYENPSFSLKFNISTQLDNLMTWRWVIPQS